MYIYIICLLYQALDTQISTLMSDHISFSLFVKPVDEPIIPSMKNNNGNELKAFGNQKHRTIIKYYLIHQ